MKGAEKFLQLEPLRRPFDEEPGASGGNIEQLAGPPPGPVDPHDVDRDRVGEVDTIRFSRAVCHEQLIHRHLYRVDLLGRAASRPEAYCPLRRRQ